MTKPTVRETHLAYVASLTDDDLRGDPDQPVIMDPRSAREYAGAITRNEPAPRHLTGYATRANR